MGAVHSLRTGGSTHANELDQRRERAHLDALSNARTLRQHALVCEANLFFVPVLGTDVVEAVTHLCTEHEFALASRDGNATDYAFLQRCVYPVTADAKWQQAPLAVQELQARQQVSIASFLPRSGPTPSSQSRVRVYTQSPLEDRLVALPMLVDERVPRTPGSAEQLALDTLLHAIELAERTQLCQCAPMRSVWVYMRMADDLWQRTLITHQAAGTAARELERWSAWRQRMDALFYDSTVRFERHTVVVNVHSEQFNVRDVRDPLVMLLARFVLRQAQAGWWLPAPLDGTAAQTLRDEFGAYLRSEDYQRARNLVLTEPRTLATVDAQLNPRTAGSMVVGPLGGASRSSTADPAPRRHSTGTPRRVDPYAT